MSYSKNRVSYLDNTEDGVESPGYVKKRFRMMTLQQEALRAPFRGDFGGL